MELAGTDRRLVGATLRTSCLFGVGVRISPWSFNRRRRASAQLGLISPERRVRHPSLQLGARGAGAPSWPVTQNGKAARLRAS